MKETIRLILVLTVICLVAGLMLAWVNGMTAAPIAEAKRLEKSEAIEEVLPPCDNDPGANTVSVDAQGTEWTFFVGRQAGQFVGAAFETVSSEGYGGDIVIMVGVAADGTVRAIKILDAKETPGLGAKIDGDEFKDQFKGLSVGETKWAVRKDQGELDAITAATISSRAVVSAVKKGLDVYIANEAKIQEPAEEER